MFYLGQIPFSKSEKMISRLEEKGFKTVSMIDPGKLR